MSQAKNKQSGLLLRYFRIVGMICIVLISFLNTRAQKNDTLIFKQDKDLKNSIKINVSSWILYQNGIQLNYERILSKKRSITLFGGIIQSPTPTIIDNSSLRFDKNIEKSGFAIGSEYRFYLAKENKYSAPHGIYLAPFVSYYHFNNIRSGRDTLTQNNLTLNTTMNFLNIGGELGYQFVIKNRFVIDCVMFGPALTSYYFNIKLEGSSSGDHDQQVQAILDALKNKFPKLKDLSSDEGISKNGISNFWTLGFRFAVHIGYRF